MKRPVHGFTLAEVLIVVTILGVLAALILPRFGSMVTKEEAAQAVTYLRLIRTAEKAFSANNSGNYFPNPAGGPIDLGVAANQTALGIELTPVNGVTFSVTTTGNPPTAFTATAAQTNVGTIILRQDGCWSGTSIYRPTQPCTY
jgi:prepilin-type N-terminal cleavage/methylation domain-containing protein